MERRQKESQSKEAPKVPPRFVLSRFEVCGLAYSTGMLGLFEAFEVFCGSHGRLCETWKALSVEMSTFLNSCEQRESYTREWRVARDEEILRGYLRKLDSKQLGYLTCDIVTALFQKNNVLPRNARFLIVWNKTEMAAHLQAATVTDDTTTPSQKLVRKYHGQMEIVSTCRVAKLVSHELYRLSNVYSQLPYGWNPCLESHCNVILHISRDEVIVEQDDVLLIRSISQNNGKYIAPLHDIDSIIAQDEDDRTSPSLLGRAFSRANQLLLRARRNEGATSTLQPISEDADGSELFGGYAASRILEERAFTRDSKRSSFSDYQSFVTAFTRTSQASRRISYSTVQSHLSGAPSKLSDNRSTIQSFISFPDEDRLESSASPGVWSGTLQQRNIVPDPELENWSEGRGQHAEFNSDERHLIPLQTERELGRGGTAVVESVRCKRVRLVKKVIRCNKRTRINRDDVIQEIQQLYKAQHSHIVRLVGTYVIDDELAILTYPCAEWNLDEFMVDPAGFVECSPRAAALREFFPCLARVLSFVHSIPIKHMDIKPQNLLVRHNRKIVQGDHEVFKIYLTDFGSSRFYPSIEDTETDGWTPFTRLYAAREVVLQEPRGLSADIFSLGCVFTEMLASFLNHWTWQLAVVAGMNMQEDYRKALIDTRGGSDGNPRPYYSKNEPVRQWLDSLPIPDNFPDLVAIRTWTMRMLDTDPTLRPTAVDIANDSVLPTTCPYCTRTAEPEPFDAATPMGNEVYHAF